MITRFLCSRNPRLMFITYVINLKYILHKNFRSSIRIHISISIVILFLNGKEICALNDWASFCTDVLSTI